ncbi:thioredoxin-disulfide reductase [Candidatus Curtissbacteria bacterium RIFCSPLOWO2_01_FULL_39_62]|uniref:Thioredoxin reductase n=2 Tax=Candidatus Curtissiibacteriota TaxID=1752717 RepID=A0A1F5G8E9_9BACT|nr:MAG: thioredoxin-disulfide reductase [Candidatus Curtissbacteria bacterium RIFCSPHIGHO2_02_FULL_40_16b]OGD90091.1 MAG: thioredoxin-disulfide reductase [Candidatus Curtissbacteria bacterium RIFCSPHIGHO2_12_FULL_38_37]OGE00500.1 MAG: thioredoxin-disulfide reductase [Candidatus Curtissbacteria bacterium RIFCSPLOWO2_02_FULL_40_11]OGE00528.1 MAG: thioredoxin-disulfide reductase [Candidatus Curtissbacteria bacterium RIFCSPLOWO2_01_FULL_39_62]
MDNVRNVIIIGSGPAGLTAALYLSRANLKPLLIAGSKWGGQLMLTTDVENYPGFPKGIQGPDLMKNFRDQAERFGTEIMDSDVTTVDFKVRPFKVKVSDRSYLTKSVIIASGADTRWLGLPNEKRLIGKGVSSCAPCDAFFFKDKRVIVAGGGDSAMEEALTLTKFASDVKIVHRREAFRASKIMVDRAKANKKISFILNSEVVDVLGRDKVEGVKINNKVDNKTSDILVDGIFVAIGHIPVTNLFQGQVDLDIKGYVMRKAKIHFGDPDAPGNYKMMTSTEGVFVAGDVHDYHYRQAVTAAGYGCMAALEVEKWVEAQ